MPVIFSVDYLLDGDADLRLFLGLRVCGREMVCDGVNTNRELVLGYQVVNQLFTRFKITIIKCRAYPVALTFVFVTPDAHNPPALFISSGVVDIFYDVRVELLTVLSHR